MTGSYDWIAWTAGGFVGLLGVCLALWALFVDGFRRRWHRQRRCPKCWYDMRHTPGATCSECGFTAKRERQLFKARRRWRWAAVAVLLMGIGWGGGVYPKARRDGWRSVVPTTVLIAALPWLDPPRNQQRSVQWLLPPQPSLLNELDDRAAPQNQLWDWQWRWLIDRAYTGDAARRSPSEQWHSKYGRLMCWADVSGHLDDDPRRQERILPCLAIADIAVRDRWPAELPLQARWVIRSGWPLWDSTMNELTVRITPRDPVLSPIEQHLTPPFLASLDSEALGISTRGYRLDRCWELATLGLLPVGTTHIDFDITFEQTGEAAGVAMPLWSTVVRRPIEVVETIQDVLVAVPSPAVDEAIRTVFQILDRWEQIPGYIGFQHVLAELADLAPITLAVTIEYVHGDEVLCSMSVWWDVQRAAAGAVSAQVAPEEYRVRWRMTDRVKQRIRAHAREGPGAVSLRIRSDPAVALRNFDCDRYWVGEVTIPLRWSDGGRLVPDQGARGDGE
ncbi:MAG: hypothetical protein KAS72_05590 [Phycisphaerales bacterium]|nr:hypothetical protein [Phycisphaerales bacterium]